MNAPSGIAPHRALAVGTELLPCEPYRHLHGVTFYPKNQQLESILARKRDLLRS
jgi:hypothetical protein